jgi:amino acid adenylation domain-containing protein
MRVALLGEGTLAWRCLQMLQGTALSPSVIVSADGSLAQAASDLTCQHFTRREDWLQWLHQDGCDVLLSIRNPWVLKDEELRQVRVQALNFHDSLLPDYAGMHATSWALLNGEAQHGVTWHAMSADLDAGAIAAQIVVPVAAADTALTLNAKCFDAALTAFGTVLSSLIDHGRCPLTPQQGQSRYFGLRRRPDSQGLLDVQGPCEQALRTVRALDFGHAHNPLALPKLVLGGVVVLVGEAHRARQPFTCAPGTLLQAGPDGLHVAFADGVLLLSALRSLDGADLPAPSIEALARPWFGRVLPAWLPEVRREITVLHEDVCVHERQWVSVLKEVITPLFHHDVLSAGTHQWHELSRWCSQLEACSAATRSDWAVAVFMVYMARIHQGDSGHLGLWRPDLARAGHGLFAACVPWPLRVDLSSTVSSHVAQTSELRRHMSELGTYSLDLRIRAPELAALPAPPDHWPVALAITSHDDSISREQGADLLVTISPDGLQIGCCVSDLCPTWLIEALDTRLATLAEAMLSTQETRLCDLPLMDEREWHQVAVSPNALVRELPDIGIHELIAQTARRTPDADALVHGDQVLSHRELDERSSLLAKRLMGAGICKGAWVALAVSRSADAVVAILAILKAGAAYVPLDVQLPAERLGAMVKQVRPALLLTQRPHLESMREHGVATWCLDDWEAGAFCAQASGHAAGPAWGDDVAYCIFTSGSTGVPKGVEVVHRGLVNHALAMVDQYQLSAGDRVLCSAAFSFDVSVEQMFPTLVAGACIVLRPDDLFDAMSRFDGWCRAQRVSVMALPTAWWHEWVRHLSLVGGRVSQALRVIAVGTEKAQAQALLQWRESGGSHTLFLQGYGPTEATITSTMFRWRLDDRSIDLSQPLPIGRPLPNTQVHLLDALGQHVPVGVEGEIHIAGVGLARGYLGSEALTRRCFLELPVPGRGDQAQTLRMYRTGDRARWTPDGQLVFMGRVDFQVKLRGHRVELGDIESVLTRHPEAQEAVVLLRDDVGPQSCLVAYVLSSSSPDASELIQICANALPVHMVPSHVVVLAQWPLTVNGKVDRRLLPALVMPTLHEAAIREHRWAHDLELLVARVFSAVLERDDVPLDVSFFDLGGDSLRAMSLITQLEQALSTRLSLVDVFASPNVRLLAARLEADRSPDQPLVIQLRGGKGTPLWFLAGVLLYAPLANALHGDGPVYVVFLPSEDALRKADGKLPPVREHAQRYLSVIRAHHPQGPVAVGGFSFGGALAYEVAQLMHERGDSVSLLVLIDTCLPGSVRRGVLVRLRRQMKSLSTSGVSKIRSHLKGAVARLRASLPGQGQPVADLAPAGRSLQPEFARVLHEFESNMKPYAGHVLLFRSKVESLRRDAPVHLGWGPWVADQQLQIHDVEGCHLGMMRAPHVASLGAKLSRVLQSMERPTAPGGDLVVLPSRP